MKTKNLFHFAILLIAIMGLTVSGCKKDKKDTTFDSTSLQQLSNDEASVQNASDEAMNDVDLFLATTNTKSTEALPCDATLDSVRVVNDTITKYITYNGFNCNHSRFRTGKVQISKLVNTPWSQAGAMVIVKHINFTIRKVSNNKTITINGIKTHQNVTGGALWQLGNGVTSIVHKTWGNETITFNDNTTRSWQVARQKTFTGTPGEIILTLDGFGNEGGYANLVVWGVNRHGENFYTQIPQSLVLRQSCDWDPVSGVKIHQIPSDSKSATLTFGYNSNNQPISGSECPTKFKVDWQKNNQSGTVYLWL
ncbi:MAG: hypothetical protein WCP32_12255 [Bacteroidota bacterium]